MDCRTCKFAVWVKTSNGRRHPNGQGRCTREIKMPQLPKAYYWVGGHVPSPSGGFIWWKSTEDHAGCQMWMQLEKVC
jgi:hypothetical protein